MMEYKEARSFIDEVSRVKGSILGLEAVKELLERLGNPQDSLNVIHIGGTNGKGSTGAFLASILASSGYRVGRYVSPTVDSYRERIQIIRQRGIDDTEDMEETGQSCTDSLFISYITREGVAEAISRIRLVCEEMVRDGFSHPTAFEIETAMTFLYLLEEKVDYLILEVGMGGRTDATNVLHHPLCTVITSVSMDHMQYLGNTLEAIAREKSGIFKAGCPVITIKQDEEVMEVLRNAAQQADAPFHEADSRMAEVAECSLEGTRFHLPGARKGSYQIRLLGEHQIKNAVLAIKVIEVLREQGCSISEQAVSEGLLQTRWRGRFEVLGQEPYFIMDGAHNEEAALMLRKSFERYFTNKRFIFMIGVLADKEYRRILELTAPLADIVITLTPDNPRALASGRLAQEAAMYANKVIDGSDVDHALSLAYEYAGKDDVIAAFGSLSFLGDVRRRWVKEYGIRNS